MSGQAIELLDLVARWLHVIAGIMWIGNSLLFNWLDRNLRPRAEPDVYGDIWLIHSGGFYLVEKNQGERAADGRRSLPAPLHWFKWQAYTTWLSGAVLLIVVYYMGGRALLVDPSVAPLGHRAGVAIAVATIVGGWAIYETIWRTLGERSRFGAGLLSILLLVAFANSLLTGLSGRAAFVHVGALLGTIMAGNVAFTIMPSQRELVAALKAGREPSQAVADRAKTRSIHNNYLTFPVIALMMSAHFPSLYANGGPVRAADADRGRRRSALRAEHPLHESLLATRAGRRADRVRRAVDALGAPAHGRLSGPGRVRRVRRPRGLQRGAQHCGPTLRGVPLRDTV